MGEEGNLVRRITSPAFQCTMDLVMAGAIIDLTCHQPDLRCLHQGHNLHHHIIDMMYLLLMLDKGVLKVDMVSELLLIFIIYRSGISFSSVLPFDLKK